MSKFYVGQKVLVTGNSYYEDDRGRECVGKVCEVKSEWDVKYKYGIYSPDKTDYWYFDVSDLQPITETPETLNINGVEYIRKPEPVVEHEWKFGDVAMHERHGVGIVTRIDGISRRSICLDIPSGNTGTSMWLDPSSLTFIRRADLSV